MKVRGHYDSRTSLPSVDEKPTLTLLRAEGVDFAQGFHLGRPGPITDPHPPRDNRPSAMLTIRAMRARSDEVSIRAQALSNRT
jgi:EAL domain-containing protein (putative c-di-GMP-specific phosphodiesterase class I)